MTPIGSKIFLSSDERPFLVDDEPQVVIDLLKLAEPDGSFVRFEGVAAADPDDHPLSLVCHIHPSPVVAVMAVDLDEARRKHDERDRTED